MCVHEQMRGNAARNTMTLLSKGHTGMAKIGSNKAEQRIHASFFELRFF